jgi:hypothetical protein
MSNLFMQKFCQFICRHPAAYLPMANVQAVDKCAKEPKNYGKQIV